MAHVGAGGDPLGVSSWRRGVRRSSARWSRCPRCACRASTWRWPPPRSRYPRPVGLPPARLRRRADPPRHTTVVPHIMHFRRSRWARSTFDPSGCSATTSITPTAQMVLATVLFVICFAIVCLHPAQPLRPPPHRHAGQRGRLRHLRPRPARHPPVGVRHVGRPWPGLGGALYAHAAHRDPAEPLRPRRPACRSSCWSWSAASAFVGGAGCSPASRLNAAPAAHHHRVQRPRQVPADPHRRLSASASAANPSGAAPQFARASSRSREDLPRHRQHALPHGGRLGRPPDSARQLAHVRRPVRDLRAGRGRPHRRRLVARGEPGPPRSTPRPPTEEVPLEWVGVTVPWTPELLAKTSRSLDLGSVTYEAVGAATIRRGGAS